jgi:hypothetical protein
MCDKMAGLSEADITEINGLFETIMRENGELEGPEWQEGLYHDLRSLAIGDDKFADMVAGCEPDRIWYDEDIDPNN